MITRSLYLSLFVVFAACAGETQNPAETIAVAADEKLGTVQFVTSCADDAVPHIERGLALLHHMTYESAESAFSEATKIDPDCAMGYWGQAMTDIHPLWSDPPTEEEFQRGYHRVQTALERGEKTALEEAFIAAADAYYGQGYSADEKPRLARFADAWTSVYDAHQDEVEAAAFHALSVLGTVDPGDKSYAKQKAASAIAEAVLAKVPDHPGAHHYVIHANDYPPLAQRALDVARSYGDIAPDIPHALHMPTHIFTRLGLWDESISWNKRSAKAALNHPVGDALSLHYLHAVDYLAYAHLQRSEDQKATDVLEELLSLDGPLQTHLASAYTLAAVPARVALERHAWDEAASLEPRIPASYPWDGQPAMEAITYFARALGAARSGNVEQAQSDLAKLEDLRDRVPPAAGYWAKQVEIQRLSALAWIQFAQDRRDEALETMRTAAQLESTTEKHPVTPGEILPARELLGDMLLELGQATAARTEFVAALERSPNRFNSLYGAGRAAELEGDNDAAAMYFRQLAEVAKTADTDRDRLRHAKMFGASG